MNQVHQCQTPVEIFKLQNRPVVTTEAKPLEEFKGQGTVHLTFQHKIKRGPLDGRINKEMTVHDHGLTKKTFEILIIIAKCGQTGTK